MTHVLPPGVAGSINTDLYPYNPAKAKSLLGGKTLKLKLLYQADNEKQTKMFQSIQFDLSKVGITITGVGVPTADIYSKYLLVPDVARRGVWDISMDQWYPDWYGDNTVNYFLPIFSSKSWAPAGANLNLYKNPKVDALIDKGATTPSKAVANGIWQQVDRLIMQDAAIYPVTSVELRDVPLEGGAGGGLRADAAGPRSDERLAFLSELEGLDAGASADAGAPAGMRTQPVAGRPRQPRPRSGGDRLGRRDRG